MRNRSNTRPGCWPDLSQFRDGSLALAIALLASFPWTGAWAMSPEEVVQAAQASIVRVAVLDAAGTAVRQGSAVVIRPNEIVANCNAVAGEGAAIVVFRGSKWALAQLLGTDRQRNICHLRWRGEEEIGVPVRGVVAMEHVRKGQVAYAVGSPRGLEVELSGGFVSDFRRHPERGMVIQLDPPVAPEASGGGLFDREARLIGLTAIVLKEDQVLDFAVPAGAVFDLVPALRSKRAVPSMPTAKEDRVDRDHVERLREAAKRLAEGRRWLEQDRLERERAQVKEQEARAAAEKAAADKAATSEAEPAPGIPAASTASTVPAHAVSQLQSISALVEQSLAGAPLPIKTVSMDFSMTLDEQGKVVRLVLDRASGDAKLDAAVITRIQKSGPYREALQDGSTGPLGVSLRVGWFHEHAAVIAMFGPLPPFGVAPAKAPTAGDAAKSASSGPTPDADGERQAREVALERLRAAEEQRKQRMRAEIELLIRDHDAERTAKREKAEAEVLAVGAAAVNAQKVVDDYGIRVREAIGDKFMIPASAQPTTRAEIEIRVLRDGTVGTFRFVKRSGLADFDRAIEVALQKAVPLPVPVEAAIYNQFRDQRMVFSGER
jgi:S1-C subfamily serine protease